MNDLEPRLRGLPLARPSAQLRERIFQGMPEEQGPQRVRPPRRRLAPIFQVRIPLGWAAAAALLMGLVGFTAARQSASTLPQQTPAPRISRTIEVQIVEVPAGRRHFFDFTGADDDLLPRGSKGRTQTGENL
jgi:hypothetical protein